MLVSNLSELISIRLKATDNLFNQQFFLVSIDGEDGETKAEDKKNQQTICLDTSIASSRVVIERLPEINFASTMVKALLLHTSWVNERKMLEWISNPRKFVENR